MVFSWDKKMMERWYLLVTEKFLFWTFPWWEISSFFSQKADVKVKFTWSFWDFHDIAGPRKYVFSGSEFFSAAGLTSNFGPGCKPQTLDMAPIRLSGLQLVELISRTPNYVGKSLKLSSNNICINETGFPHKILLTDGQVSNFLNLLQIIFRLI